MTDALLDAEARALAAEAEVARLTAEREKDRECYGCVNPNNACARCKPRLARLEDTHDPR